MNNSIEILSGENDFVNYINFTIVMSQQQMTKRKDKGGNTTTFIQEVKFERDFKVSEADVLRENGNDYILGTGKREMDEYVDMRETANKLKAGFKRFKSTTPVKVRIYGNDFLFDSDVLEKKIGEKLYYSANKRLQLQCGARMYFGLCQDRNDKLNEKRAGLRLKEQNETLRMELQAITNEKRLLKAEMKAIG